MSPFPAMRNVIRARVNPNDICSVVSIFPRKVKIIYPTIQPGLFEFAPGTPTDPVILHIGSSSWWKETGEGEPALEIPDNSLIVADAIVRDYIGGMLGCDMADRTPGLFFIPGRISMVELKTQHKPVLDLAIARQNNWFDALIEMGDVLWARTNGNPRAISEDMKLAAEMRGVKEQKPWMQNYVASALIPCVACGNLRNPLYPVCQTCNTIVDGAKYKELGLVPLGK